jgi:hypothetical protein
MRAVWVRRLPSLHLPWRNLRSYRESALCRHSWVSVFTSKGLAVRNGIWVCNQLHAGVKTTGQVGKAGTHLLFNGDLVTLAFRTQAQAKCRPRMVEVRRDRVRTAFQITKQARDFSDFYWLTTVWTNHHIPVRIFLSCCVRIPSRVLTTHRDGSSLWRIWRRKPCQSAACVAALHLLQRHPTARMPVSRRTYLRTGPTTWPRPHTWSSSCTYHCRCETYRSVSYCTSSRHRVWVCPSWNLLILLPPDFRPDLLSTYPSPIIRGYPIHFHIRTHLSCLQQAATPPH